MRDRNYMYLDIWKFNMYLGIFYIWEKGFSEADVVCGTIHNINKFEYL